jgi:hypothetical protein
MRLLQQEDRDAVADLEDATTLGAGQTLSGLVVGEHCVMLVRAAQYLQQCGIE